MNQHAVNMKNALNEYKKATEAAKQQIKFITDTYGKEAGEAEKEIQAKKLERARATAVDTITKAAGAGHKEAEAWGRLDGSKLTDDIKLLDAGERLGIQVHPTKEYAKAHFGTPYGKTECWYILDTRDEDACVYIGFKEHVTREYFKELFDRQDVPAMLKAMHCFRVRKGDVILVTAGTPHAIGAGCFLLEIQEPTDYTMRAEKITLAGEALTPQQIHYGVGEEAMLDCFSYCGSTREETRRRHFLQNREARAGEIDLVQYTDTECFALKRIESGAYEAKEACFVTVVVTEDGGTLSYGARSVPLMRGEKYFISANTEFALTDATVVLCYPPRI